MSKTTKPLTIVRLTASNVMRLKAGIEIVPHGNTVVVTGKNEGGKSSVLNCILFALGGKTVLSDKPVRSGALKADVHLDLGEIVVDWKCSAASSVSLLVREKDGGEIKSPQKALDALWNAMCDPVKFIRLSETPDGRRKQAETLRQIVGLDFAALDRERADVYAEREDKGRDLRRESARRSAMRFHADTPEVEVSIPDVVEKLRQGREHNDAIEKAHKDIKERSDSIIESEEDISRIRQKIVELENTLKATRDSLHIEEDALQSKRKRMLEAEDALKGTKRVDLTVLETQISEANNVNERVRENAARRKVDADVAAIEDRVAVLTRQLEEIDEEKRTKLAAAKFPVDGLSFDENGIMLDGVPFNQGSQAKQLLAATAIALALKPRIRVVLLRDASLFDSDTRKELAELAARESAQVWEEIVESDDPSAIVIEDGEVKEPK